MSPATPSGVDEAVVGLARTGAAPRRLAAAPLLQALRAAGTRHVYADTADVAELAPLLEADGALRLEVDGNTANQPLVRRVVERQRASDDPRPWARALARAGVAERSRPLLYAVLAGRIALEAADAFGAGRAWEASVQLHMDLGSEPDQARRVGHLIHRMLPSAFVKVPFRPDAPGTLCVARDLERAGVRVNLTSTFSARQAVVAALFADVSRTNVFMGRLNQGLQAELLGEHVCLVAQRALRELRRRDGVKTGLIVASMRGWETFARLAGCDVFTAPCPVLADFLRQEALDANDLPSRLEVSYADDLGIAASVAARLGRARIERLYRIEPELVAFLRELRQREASEPSEDGESIQRRFEEAGFADLFHVPQPEERRELERDKLPDLEGALVQRIPLDTHYTLLANADFVRHQQAIDAELEKRLDA